MKRELFKPSYSACGCPSYYVVCWKCGRGIGVTKYGIVRKHYRKRKSIPDTICEASGTHYRTKEF